MANNEEITSIKVKFGDNKQVTISVKLINGDKENPAEVFGTITGRFQIDSQFEIFDRNQDHHVSVRPGRFIPLSRPEVNVPSGATEMEIEAYLKDYDLISRNDEIANGKATFIVKADGESDKRTINGKYGSIEVIVVWG